MNRARRRADAKATRAYRWANLARDWRALAGNELVAIEDRVALRDGAARLDRGDRPTIVVWSLRATLARIDALAAQGEL